MKKFIIVSSIFATMLTVKSFANQPVKFSEENCGTKVTTNVERGTNTVHGTKATVTNNSGRDVKVTVTSSDGQVRQSTVSSGQKENNSVSSNDKNATVKVQCE